MSNQYERGGIVSFIMVGVALAGLLVGGLYLSKHQARVARESDTSTPQVAQQNEQKQDEQKSDEQQGSGSSEAPAQQNQQPSQPQNTPTTPQQQPAPQNNARSSQNNSNNATNRVANTGPSDSIPSTGPTETGLIALGLGSLAFTGYKLVDSRRSFRRSALKS